MARGTDLELEHGLVARLDDPQPALPDERVLPPVLRLPAAQRRARRDLVDCEDGQATDVRRSAPCSTSFEPLTAGARAHPHGRIPDGRLTLDVPADEEDALDLVGRVYEGHAARDGLWGGIGGRRLRSRRAACTAGCCSSARVFCRRVRDPDPSPPRPASSPPPRPYDPSPFPRPGRSDHNLAPPSSRAFELRSSRARSHRPHARPRPDKQHLPPLRPSTSPPQLARMDGAPPPEEDFSKIALPERSVHKVRPPGRTLPRRAACSTQRAWSSAG